MRSRPLAQAGGHGGDTGVESEVMPRRRQALHEGLVEKYLTGWQVQV